MSADNADLLNDLNNLMKGVRRRYYLHLNLVEYMKKLLEGDDEISMFIEYYLRGHRAFQSDQQTKETKLREYEDRLRERYGAGETKLAESDLKLVGRLSTRILEICQASFEKLKHYFPFYEEGHSILQEKLTNGMIYKLHLTVLLDTIIVYSRKKWEDDIASLAYMIYAIESGERERIPFVTMKRYEKIRYKQQAKQAYVYKKKREQQLQQQVQLDLQTRHERMLDRVEKARELSKLRDEQKKKKTKFFEKVYCKLYGVLEPNRQQLADDIIYTCRQEYQYKRLYTDMLERNSNVGQEIQEFFKKADDFQDKVRKFRESMVLQPIRKNSHIRISLPATPRKEHSLECLTNPTEAPSPQSPYVNQLPKASDIIEILELKTERKSMDSVDKKSSYSPIGRFPHITPFIERRLKKYRYDSVTTRNRRQSDAKDGQPIQQGLTSSQAARPTQYSRVMQVPLIQLNMVYKFEFKVVHEQPKKRYVLSKAFEYTFHFRKRENRFQETKTNFIV